MVKLKYFGLVLLIASTAWAADPLPPAVVKREPISAIGQDLRVKLSVDKIKLDLLAGDELGHTKFGAFCINQQPLTVTEAVQKNYGQYVATVVTQELKRLGYPLATVGTKTSAFDTDVAGAPDYRIGGILKELKMEICQTGANSEGWVYLKIDWALFSEREQKVAFQKTTEGLHTSADKIPDLAKRAITSGFGAFLAEPEVLAQLKSEAVAATASAAKGTATVAGAPALQIELAGTASQGGAQKNQAKLRAAVVTLETAGGMGSGFYIHRDGYLLTDFHVVNGAKFVRVKLPNGDKMVAQVVKVSERDDVALLKTPAIDFEPLAIRRDVLEVGEDVYAIGSPLGVLTNTMTRGVLSADRVYKGVRVLQSDAAVTFGSSGGPLLDAEGRVIGLTKSGMAGEKGFNFFIPILDAVRVMEIGTR